MVNRKLIGILAITLASGILAVGCDNGSTNGNSTTNTNSGGGTKTSIDGTYYLDEPDFWEFTFNNGNFSERDYGYVTAIGTYTISGNNLTIKYNQLRLLAASFNAVDKKPYYVQLSDFYSTKEQYIAAVEKFYKDRVGIGLCTEEEANICIAEDIERADEVMKEFLPKTYPYSFNGNVLILSSFYEDGESIIFIKK